MYVEIVNECAMPQCHFSKHILLLGMPSIQSTVGTSGEREVVYTFQGHWVKLSQGTIPESV